MPSYDTLEAAQERIIELENEVGRITAENGDLTSQLSAANDEVENLRTINQRYFNKLLAQESNKKEPDDDEEAPSCEEFAASLKL